MSELNFVLRTVPTLDDDVRSMLQLLDQPQTVYGEDNAIRRERLLELISNSTTIQKKYVDIIENGQTAKDGIDKNLYTLSYDGMMDDVEAGEEEEEEEEDEDFYTPGSEALYDIRVKIANFSIAESRKRLEKQYLKWKSYKEEQILSERRNYYEKLGNISLEGSQLVSDRYISTVKYNNNLIACGSWDGKVYLMNSQLEILDSIQGLDNNNQSGSEKIGSLDWCENKIAFGNADGVINIANVIFEDNKFGNLITLKGHLSRVMSTRFHPMGNLLISASSDMTWRLWDLNKKEELYYQEGHTAGVNAIDVHPDGSLLASGGADALVKLWDLRTGKQLPELNKRNENTGHIRSVQSLKWRENGYHLLSGGADSNLVVWDIRMMKAISTIPAHTKMITDIKILPGDLAIATTGYDGCVTISECDSWRVRKRILTGVSEKIMAIDAINFEGELNIVTGGWDRGVKFYAVNNIN